MKVFSFKLVLTGLLAIAIASALPHVGRSAMALQQVEGLNATVLFSQACKEGVTKCMAANDDGKGGSVFICKKGYWNVLAECADTERCISDPIPHCTWNKKAGNEELPARSDQSAQLTDDVLSSNIPNARETIGGLNSTNTESTAVNPFYDEDKNINVDHLINEGSCGICTDTNFMDPHARIFQLEATGSCVNENNDVTYNKCKNRYCNMCVIYSEHECGGTVINSKGPSNADFKATGGHSHHCM